MARKLWTTAFAAAALVEASGTALAQDSSPKATGPTGAEFMEMINGWFTMHQGVAISIGLGAIVVAGLVVWNMMSKPSAGQK